MWFSPLFSSKEKLEQASLKVLWSSLSAQNVSSKVTVLLKIHLIFPSLNSPGKVSELITRVSSREQATFFFFMFKMGSSFARNNRTDNFKNWSCEDAVRITQSCLLHLPDAAARFLFFWAVLKPTKLSVQRRTDGWRFLGGAQMWILPLSKHLQALQSENLHC